MEEQDVRWIQRFQNYEKALVQLQEAVQITYKRELTNLESQGLIKAFEFTHELAWNVIKDYFEDQQGNTSIRGSRDAVRMAFKMELILDGEGWMDMIKSRNQTAHTYNEETANEIVEKVLHTYADLFSDFASVMKGIRTDEQNSTL